VVFSAIAGASYTIRFVLMLFKGKLNLPSKKLLPHQSQREFFVNSDRTEKPFSTSSNQEIITSLNKPQFKSLILAEAPKKPKLPRLFISKKAKQEFSSFFPVKISLR